MRIFASPIPLGGDAIESVSASCLGVHQPRVNLFGLAHAGASTVKKRTAHFVIEFVDRVFEHEFGV
jgi:hypothetical protein